MATFSYTLPTVGGSEDTWGTTLNANWTALGTFLGSLDSAELAVLDGITSTTAELNLLSGLTDSLTGLTATAAELNLLDGATATTAEINILDGVTAATAEINILDGDTSATATTLVDADRLVANDDGTMVQVAMSDVSTYTLGSLSIDEDDMVSDSDTKLPTQQSVKAYVDDYGSPTLSTDGGANLPGGLQIRWGVELSTSDTDESFTFSSAFSNGCFIVQVQFEDDRRDTAITAKSTTGFTLDRDDNISDTKTFNYFAIGY